VVAQYCTKHDRRGGFERDSEGHQLAVVIGSKGDTREISHQTPTPGRNRLLCGWGWYDWGSYYKKKKKKKKKKNIRKYPAKQRVPNAKQQIGE